MHNSVFLRAAAVCVSVWGLAGLASCTQPSSHITIGIPAANGNPMDLPARDVLEQEYVQAIHRGEDRWVQVAEVKVADRLDELRSGSVTMTYGCVGELLDHVSPREGEKLRHDYAADFAAGEVDELAWRERAHASLVAALPAELTASDPSPAQGCGDDSLPQNVVSVWSKADLDRDDRRALNNISGRLTTSDLEQVD